MTPLICDRKTEKKRNELGLRQCQDSYKQFSVIVLKISNQGPVTGNVYLNGFVKLGHLVSGWHVRNKKDGTRGEKKVKEFVIFCRPCLKKKDWKNLDELLHELEGLFFLWETTVTIIPKTYSWNDKIDYKCP